MKKMIYLIIASFISCALNGENINRDEAKNYYNSKGIITGEFNGMVDSLDFTGLRKNISDKDLEFLPLFPEVVAIHLSGCKNITNESLRYLSDLDKLEILNLADTKITDAGLKYLKNLKSLKELDLFNTKVTDKGIQELASVKSLTLLMLHGTKVTQKGIDELKKKLPNCYITLESREELQ